MKNQRATFFLEPSPGKNVIKISNENDDNTPLKRSRPAIFYTKKKKRKRFSPRFFIIPLFCLFFTWLLLYSYAEVRLAPQIHELAEAQAKKHLTKSVNEAVASLAAKGEVSYEKMVRTIRDSKGEVIYLEVDTAMLAGAKAKLVSRIDEHLENNKKITLSVPVGSLSDWNLFSGYGIPIRVRIYPIGITEGEIFTVLEDCGINQTRHLIQVKIKATLFLVLPGENARVETEVTLPLGERVLVGDVPEIYLDTLGVG